MLTLEMELLTGVYRASLVDQSGAEWPPHPERVFSALVQAWGDGGQQQEERAALEWLEGLDGSPSIEASEVNGERTAPTVYVPPNDTRSADVSILPALRKRQARQFRAVVPLEPLPAPEGTRAHVRFSWNQSAPESYRRHLQALAHRVSSVGHTSSLVRLLFREEPHVGESRSGYTPREDGDTPLRVAYPGRLKDLEHWYSTEDGKRRERPKVRATVRYAAPSSVTGTSAVTVFGAEDNWIVLAAAPSQHPDARVDDYTPDILAFPRLAKCIRNALMKFAPPPPPEIITGHKADRTPSDLPHLAVVPLLDVGWKHSDGALLGAGLVLPRSMLIPEKRAVYGAVQNWMKARRAASDEQPIGEARLARTAVWRLTRAIDDERISLRPSRYCAAARWWASVTPIFLDRFPKGTSEMGEVDLIVQACANVGLPERDLDEVQIHKHSAVRAAETTYPSRGRAHRPDWSFPEECSYRNRPRRHVVLRFRNPVRGPILLGAGRFHGMGLLLPLRDNSWASPGVEP